jgi:hypothetical protein
MEVDDSEEQQPQGWRERRADERHPASADTVLVFLDHGLELEGRIEDLSLSGVRIATEEPCPRAVGVPVELAFSLRRMSFRLAAVVSWSDGHKMGLHFGPMGAQRRAELDEVIAELAIQATELREPPVPPATTSTWTENSPSAQESATKSPEPTVSRSPSRARERRAQKRQAADLTAALYLIHSAVKLNGRIRNLSLGGCRIQLDQRARLDIYTRLEAGFYHLGLPFRVAGVVQDVYGPQEVGIRFLDVSERNREKLLGLLEELGTVLSPKK